MFRAAQISEKLAYAENRRKELMDEMFRAKKEAVEPEFIAHTSAEILSTARECLDYCGQDIIDNIIIPNTNNTKILQLHNSKQLKGYFPLYKQQLTRGGSVFKELKTIAKQSHTHLYSLAAKMEKNDIIPGTLFHYGDILVAQQMVNEKKHNKLVAILSDENQEILIEGKGFDAIFPKKKQAGWNKLVVQPVESVKEVAEFVFEYNNSEVGYFCMTITKSTKIILDEIYNNYMIE